MAKGTAALGLLDQLKQIEQTTEKDLTEEVMKYYREIKAQFDAAKAEIDAVDIAPKVATDWMHRSNLMLAASCVALGAGTVGAIWFMPATAICPQ